MEQVTSTDLQRKLGQILSKAKREPITITTRGRPELVMVDAAEYERLKSYDTRRALYPHELSNEIKAELEKGYQGEPTPELDHLLD